MSGEQERTDEDKKPWEVEIWKLNKGDIQRAQAKTAQKHNELNTGTIQHKLQNDIEGR